MAEKGLSVRRACAALRLSRSAWYRQPLDRLARDREDLVEQHRRWGFWMCFKRIRLDGHRWNHKRVYRIYRRLGLNMKRRTKKRIPARVRQPMKLPPLPNAAWSVDFMHDRLYVGRRFRTLNVLDEGVREGLDIEIDTPLSGERVIRVLDRLKTRRGLPLDGEAYYSLGSLSSPESQGQVCKHSILDAWGRARWQSRQRLASGALVPAVGTMPVQVLGRMLAFCRYYTCGPCGGPSVSVRL